MTRQLERFIASRGSELVPHVYDDPALGVVAPLWSRDATRYTVQIGELAELLKHDGRFLMERNGRHRALRVTKALRLLSRVVVDGSAFMSAQKTAMWWVGDAVELAGNPDVIVVRTTSITSGHRGRRPLQIERHPSSTDARERAPHVHFDGGGPVPIGEEGTE